MQTAPTRRTHPKAMVAGFLATIVVALLPANAQATLITPKPVVTHAVTPQVVVPPPTPSQSATQTTAAPSSPPPSAPAASDDPQSDSSDDSQSDSPSEGTPDAPSRKLMSEEDYDALDPEGLLAAWEDEESMGELARDFIVAYWGRGSDAGWNGAPDTSGSDQTDSSDPDQAWAPETDDEYDVYNDDSLVAVADFVGGLGDAFCPNDGFQSINRMVEDPGGARGCF